MKKIIGGILGIFLVIGIVAGVGYALFSSKVTITGMVLGTATPGLQASIDNSAYVSSYNIGGSIFQLLVPGKYDWGEFYLKNTSTGDLDFNVTGQITHAEGDWGLLNGLIQMRLCVYDDAPNIQHCNAIYNTGWKTLTLWNAGEITLPGGELKAGEVRHYAIGLYFDDDAGNTYFGKKITNATFEITGTQVTP